jgi:hypothetical protein
VLSVFTYAKCSVIKYRSSTAIALYPLAKYQAEVKTTTRLKKVHVIIIAKE